MAVKLVLTKHTLGEIRQALIVTLDSNNCTNVHISHPTMFLLTKHLHKIKGIIRSGMDHTLLHYTFFHHLQIMAMSPLIPRDRSLHITLDNITHARTPPGAASNATPHILHLFLNPHNRFHYLQHTHTIDDRTTHRIEITTSMPSPIHTKRRPMIRTVTYAPDLIMMLTFPAEFTQHQLSIVTLATHLILSAPILITRASWDTIRQDDSHQHTL